METTIKTKFSDEFGTFYGLYVGDILIHREYCKSAAKDVQRQLTDGLLLADIIEKKLKKFYEPKIERLKGHRIRTENDKSIANNVKIKTNNIVVNKYSQYGLNETEMKELELLISDMKRKRFTYSKELSNYIITNKLGHKYPNISGKLTFQKGRDEWDLDGAFPTEIFNIVKKELGLRTQNSGAIPTKFTPFAQKS